jgi:hypothetical protein
MLVREGKQNLEQTARASHFFALLELQSVPRVHSFGVSSEISLRIWLMFVRLIKPGARHCGQQPRSHAPSMFRGALVIVVSPTTYNRGGFIVVMIHAGDKSESSAPRGADVTSLGGERLRPVLQERASKSWEPIMAISKGFHHH